LGGKKSLSVDLPLPQTTTQYKQPLHRIIDHSPGQN
jgi:hypothetical protein